MKKVIICFAAVVIALCLLCSCGSPEKTIIGSWKYQTSVLGVVTETTYTFNEDGTGSMNAIIGIAFEYSFSGDKLFITTNLLGMENTDEYVYKFDGKDKLTLTKGGESMTLERVS